MSFLQVRELVSGYDRSTVLNGVDLDLAGGAVLGLLGRNGAGKSTLVMTLMGLLPPTSGSVQLDGVELAGRRPDQIARAGVAVVPQGRRVWVSLTVAEHLALVARVAAAQPSPRGRRLDRRRRAGAAAPARRTPPALRRPALRRGAADAGRGPGAAHQPPGGAAGRAVRGAGPGDRRPDRGVVRTLRDDGVAVLLVEQDLHLAFAVAGEIAVMEKGAIVHRVPTEVFRRDPDTAHRLLGVA